jgi:hypothetical protein
MSGIINNLDSSELALLANKWLGSHGASSIDMEALRREPPQGGADYSVAQVYATLALAQAVRELAEQLRAGPVGGPSERQP